MIDREKVIRGLEACISPEMDSCNRCPYNTDKGECCRDLRVEALELIKGQSGEPEVRLIDAAALRADLVRLFEDRKAKRDRAGMSAVVEAELLVDTAPTVTRMDGGENDGHA